VPLRPCFIGGVKGPYFKKDFISLKPLPGGFSCC
jgi:hypothetical protein